MSEWTGLLEMEAEDRRGKTVTNNLFFQGAFKIMRPVYHKPDQPCFYILNPGGGYLDGDTYRINVSAKEDSKLTLTTQASTKVYKTPHNPAYQETEFFLEEGSYLEYLPDPLIAYKDARYIQKNIIRMKKGATFIGSDIVTPGWSPDGEYFDYDSLRLLNEFYMEDELVGFDHVKLEPKEQHMNGLGYMEGYTHLGSFFVVGEKTDEKLIDRLQESIQETSADVKAGLSQLNVPGFSIRVMARSSQVIENIFSRCHELINKEWFDTKPSFLRKY